MEKVTRTITVPREETVFVTEDKMEFRTENEALLHEEELRKKAKEEEEARIYAERRGVFDSKFVIIENGIDFLERLSGDYDTCQYLVRPEEGETLESLEPLAEEFERVGGFSYINCKKTDGKAEGTFVLVVADGLWATWIGIDGLMDYVVGQTDAAIARIAELTGNN